MFVSVKMEEPPKIERLLSSRGIALKDAANILKSYVEAIDHVPRKPVDITTVHPSTSDDQGSDGNQKNKTSRQDIEEERETERLLVEINQLDPKKSSISDDVYERLQMIMKSMVGEAEGRPVSAVGVYVAAKAAEKSGSIDDNNEGDGGAVQQLGNNEEDDFVKELEEAARLEMGHTQQQQQDEYEKKKKDKKAKKAAKKAKKEAKKRNSR